MLDINRRKIIDKQGVQAHGISAGRIVDNFIPGNESGAVNNFKKPVVFHTGGSAHPLVMLSVSDRSVGNVLYVVGINVPGYQRIQVRAASVRHDKFPPPDILHVKNGGFKGGCP